MEIQLLHIKTNDPRGRQAWPERCALQHGSAAQALQKDQTPTIADSEEAKETQATNE